MSRSLSVIVVTLLSFGIYFGLTKWYFADLRVWIDSRITNWSISHLLAYLVVSLPVILGASIINEFKRCQTTLGLNRSIPKGILFASVCVLPMFMGFALLFDFNRDLSMDEIIIAGVSAAFFEEFIFRGFLFGQLFRFTKLGFIPAVLLGASLFASLHLYQNHDFGILIGIFSTTFMGAVLFAWLFAEWNFNLWVSVFLHFFMNLAWMLFAVSDNAFGGLAANLIRMLTIALAIILTVVYKRKMGIPLAINRDTLWIKHHRNYSNEHSTKEMEA